MSILEISAGAALATLITFGATYADWHFLSKFL